MNDRNPSDIGPEVTENINGKYAYGYITTQDVQDLANAIAERLEKGAFCIPAETNDATKNYRGFSYSFTVGSGQTPVRVDIKFEMNGDITQTWSYMSGVEFWKCTLKPHTERLWS